MTPSTRPAGGRGIASLALAGTVIVLALASCAEDGQGSSASTTTTSAPSTTSGNAGSDECENGTYEVSRIDGTKSVDLEGQQLVFSGEVTGLELTLDDASWKLAGDDAMATVRVAGVAEVDATIDGSAGGTVTSSGERHQFALEEAEGSVELTLEGIGTQRLDMGDVSTALAPVGDVTMNCTGDTGTLEADVVKFELRKVGGTSGTSTTSRTTTRTSSTSGSSGSSSTTATTTSK